MPKIVSKKSTLPFSKKPEITAKPEAETPEEEVSQGKCKAKDIGHSACKCGGNYCGDKVTG